MPRTPAAKRGPELIDDIRQTPVPFGHVGVWWLGQATFCFKFGSTLVYTDPFYRDENGEPKTLAETPLKPHEYVGAAIICCTHEHLDHIDPETLPGAALASHHAKIVLPNWTVDFAAGLGVPRERMAQLRGDDSVTFEGVAVHAIPAAHMTLDHDEKLGYRYLGYVLEGNGVRIYHPGDMQPYPGWYERVKRYDPLDAAFLPINGVDNLHWQQAVYFCALHHPKLAVPMHYNMFTGYTEDPAKFTEALARNCPQQRSRVMTVGEGWLV